MKMAAVKIEIIYSELICYTEDEDLAKAVAVDLRGWGCCPRCILRYLGEERLRYYSSIQAIEAWHDSWLPDKAEDKTEASTVCIACLGVLQHQYCHKAFLDEIIDIVKKENYEITSFTPGLSLTVMFQLREHALWIALKEKHKSMYFGKGPEDVLSIKEIWKDLNGAYLSEKLGAPMEAKNTGKLEITLNFQHPSTNSECSFLLDAFPDVFRKRKSKNNRRGLELFSRANVAKAINDMSEAKFKRSYSCPPRRLAMPVACDPITCLHEAMFIAGRYNKYCRELSQTPWIVEGERKMDTSVQELICDSLQKHVRATDYRFSTSGREDVDVRCLGNGRPFLIEFINPHVVTLDKAKLNALQDEINAATDRVAVQHLQVVTRDDTVLLKVGEEEKTKCYSAYCWTEEPITQQLLDNKLLSIKDLTLKQKTPIRVLHRRSLAVRERVIHSASAKLTDDRHFTLSLKTQAGTYIKEFVHGDFGRTVPSLKSVLGVECDILDLDVESVDINWPPPVE